MLDVKYYAQWGLGSVCEKVLAGERLSYEDGLRVFQCADITALGALAHAVRHKMHGLRTYYVVNRHINYTNVCVNECTFCAFCRKEATQEGAFTLSKDVILTKVREAMGYISQKGDDNNTLDTFSARLQLDELHIVGGCHPELPLAWFEDVLQSVCALCPGLKIKAFTAVEIAHFAKLEGISTLEVLQRLQTAGLVMMPGGGAEIFASEVREKICAAKADADTWLKVSAEAHSLGIRTNATMLYGHIENPEHRIDHLCRLREQQDASGGFTCFIPLPFQTKNSALQLPKEQYGPHRGLDQLRTVAISRLMLDNIPHIKAYWVMMGTKLAQTALWYGANDLDGTIVEEHIGHMAGAQSEQGMTIQTLEDMIRASGFIPVRRDATFATVEDTVC